jgi:hypothetical protein
MKLEYKRMGESFSHDIAVDFDPDSHKVVIGGLNEKTVQYLLQYGWTQSLQDSIAGREKKVRAECSEDGIVDEAEIESAVKNDIIGQLGKRSDSILSGMEAKSSGERADTFFNKVARDLLKIAADKIGKKLPKTSDDEYKSIFEKFCVNNKAKIENEMKKRLEAKDEDFEI